ncbi:hypothetical protein [Taklimakanibacter albus]|uniref:Uncharacterized protein n=1 Tax=Taklimakanibacter albus TaxID=2800327 RepID=A0ACC5QXW0_9HYPH|nr:hypothetical protein [Aestuariivirga sp. YIM B02566]MBK1865225.1 hypothetical protein [Aestuariivirga sp. YIM B02566]
MHTTLDPFLKDASQVESGSTIRIRLSPMTPGSSELALAPDGTQGLIALGAAAVIGAYGWYYLRRKLARQNADRARD